MPERFSESCLRWALVGNCACQTGCPAASGAGAALEGSGFAGAVFEGPGFDRSGVDGSGFAGSAFAFGMIENLSWKLCAAAGFTCIPIHAEMIATAILERGRMIGLKNNSYELIDNAKIPAVVPAH